MPDRPHIVIDPAQNFGRPSIARTRVPIPAALGLLDAGEPPDVVLDELSLTLPDLLICCWYEARYGMYGTPREAWADWLEQWESTLWRTHYDQVPLPPFAAAEPRKDGDRER
jgi:uncharacterized protein (DUF433 family)